MQELHRNNKNRKRDYPANTDYNVASWVELCTKTV